MFSTIRSLSHDEIQYRQFAYTSALYKRTPFKVLVFEAEKGRAVVIVFSKTANGAVTTRHMRFSTENAEQIAELLRDEFPLLEIQYLDAPPDEM